jgi:hypothetical protein
MIKNNIFLTSKNMSFYLLRCLDGYYLGYTKNLSRRLTEHIQGKSYCTILNKPQMLMGVYDELPLLMYFLLTSNEVEDFLTERMLIEKQIIRGGKYTTKQTLIDERKFSNDKLLAYPLCNCGIPALLSENGFICPATNINVSNILAVNCGCSFRLNC